MALLHNSSDKLDGDTIDRHINSELIEVKQTSWAVDGDQLKFQGTLLDNERKEKVIVRYTFSDEKEKKEFIATIPAFLSVEGELDFPNAKTNFNQFDYQRYLKREQITYILSANQLSRANMSISFFYRNYKVDPVRQNLLDYCDRSFTPITSRYIKALIFGDKRELSEDVTTAFKNLGIIHLLSISGLHISLLISIVDKILTKLTVSKESKQLILLVLLPAFGFLAGFGISVFRAVVQAWTGYLSDLKKWALTSLDCWSVAFTSAILLNPSIIFSIGFQLSFTMSFLILFVSQLPFFHDYTPLKQINVLNFLLFLVSIPILSYHYYDFSLGVLLLNSLYIPFVSYLLMPGLLLLLFISPTFFILEEFSLIERPVEMVLILMEKLTTMMDRSMVLTFISGRFSLAVTLLWVVLVIAVLLVLENKKSVYYLISLATLFFLLVHINRYSLFGQIIMLDVGQGDAIVIKMPFNQGNYLIDTGGTIRWGENEDWQVRESDYSLASHVIIPVLKSYGINELDAIIISHAHFDHYGEVVEIVNSFPVNKIITNQDTVNNASFKEELLKLDDYSLVIDIIEGDYKNRLPINMELINDNWVDNANVNNQSMVLIGKYGKLVWLFTGDIESEREKSILSDYPTLKADVLKVSHHGSSTSTHDAFLKQVEPEYSLTSVGKRNRFGHPDQSTISRLAQYSNTNYRTDINGSIRYTYSEISWINEWLHKKGAFESINN